jgi:NADH:ubiquinone oxidoreductase subunit 5 (subunit L)/multisubunit Na+/H+ antiporter MnhA subunit
MLNLLLQIGDSLGKYVTGIVNVNVDTSVELYKRDSYTFATLIAPSEPLKLWVSAFKKIRVYSRRGQTIPLPANFNNIIGSAQQFIDYYFPIAIFVGLLILGGILMFLSCCCMCCCQLCFRKSFRKKYAKQKVASIQAQEYAWALYFTPIVLVGICIAVHLMGSNWFSVGVETMQLGITEIFTDSETLLNSTIPTIVTVLYSLKSDINKTIDNVVDSVHLNEIDTKVTSPLYKMCTDLNYAQASVINLKANSTALNNKTTTLKANLNALVSSTMLINDRNECYKHTNRIVK